MFLPVHLFFAMVVLEDQLKAVYPEIDMVTTPVGSPVAMVHANNCTSEINAWVGLFREFAELFGMDISQNDLFEKLFKVAMEGDADCGDMMSYGYYSGEKYYRYHRGPSTLCEKTNQPIQSC